MIRSFRVCFGLLTFVPLDLDIASFENSVIQISWLLLASKEEAS